MPKYRIQLKQGKRTIVENQEFKSVTHALDFYNNISTMKVTEILKIEYEDEVSTIPLDDFNYKSLFKGFIKNDASKCSRQVILHNIKNTKSDLDVFDAIKLNMDIGSLSVDSVYCSLFKV